MDCVSCDICVYCLGSFGFSPGVFLSSRVTGACPVTTDLIMRVNVRQQQPQQQQQQPQQQQQQQQQKLCEKKRYGSHQETVTAKLRNRGAMNHKELVSETGTRLS